MGSQVWATLPCGMWHSPGIEPVSPALAGGFLSTGSPGKSLSFVFCFYRMRFESRTLVFSFLLLRDIMSVIYVYLFFLAYDCSLVTHSMIAQLLHFLEVMKSHSFEYKGFMTSPVNSTFRRSLICMSALT